MSVQQNKRSKIRVRNRKAAQRYEGQSANVCTTCGAAVLPHRVCKACGNYNGTQVIQVKAAKEN